MLPRASRPVSRLAAALVAVISLCCLCAPAQAQQWPAKTVRILIGTAPGGTADTLGRLLAQKFSEDFKESFIVENITGAGGLIACELVRKAAPDGYTLLVTGGSQHTILPTITKNFPYDSVRDFDHIAMLGGPPTVLVVNPDLPARSLKELIALAEKDPGKLSYGSPGVGTTGHLIGEHFKQLTKIGMVHVPYRGANPAVADVIAGHIPAASTTLVAAAPQIAAGKVRALAVTADRRVDAFPDVPTFAELGYPDLTSLAWFALSGPRGLPPAIVQRLNADTRRILQLPEVRERLRPEGFLEPSTLDAEAFTGFLTDELKRWATVIRTAGVQIEN
jgi:tripartite-type tricarboxylate transporter receptor subunit TctC